MNGLSMVALTGRAAVSLEAAGTYRFFKPDGFRTTYGLAAWRFYFCCGWSGPLDEEAEQQTGVLQVIR